MNSPTFTVAATYREPKAALDWLARAFGFEVTMAIEGADGDSTMSHYEMAMGGRGRIMIGSEWAAWMSRPKLRSSRWLKSEFAAGMAFTWR